MAKLIKPSESPHWPVAAYEREALPDWARDGAVGGAPLDPVSILNHAHREAQRILQDAYEEGLQRGIEAGKEQFRRETGEAAAALANAAEAIRCAHDQFLTALEPQVVALAQAIAQRVLHREARTDPELVARTVRHALANLADRARLVVRLNPRDLETIKEFKPKLVEEFDGIRQLELAADDTIAIGGCVVDSELTQVDAQLDAQLERIFEAMTE